MKLFSSSIIFFSFSIFIHGEHYDNSEFYEDPSFDYSENSDYSYFQSESIEPETTESTTIATTTEEPYFSEMPETMQIIYIDAMTLLQFDNKGEKMMGVSNVRCDTGKINLATDFNPRDTKDIKMHTTCFEDTWPPRNDSNSILTIMNVPRRYVPIHKCMHVKIRYVEQIPTLGPHRPLWAAYGDYKFCPPQRWLHNVEHGAIVALYHPCADPEQINLLKKIIKGCLFRHIITPYLNLTRERPVAVVGWSASMEMGTVDANLIKNFVRFYAKTGPERVFRDGQYRSLMMQKSTYVTNVIDSRLCPGL